MNSTEDWWTKSIFSPFDRNSTVLISNLDDKKDQIMRSFDDAGF